MGSTLKLSSLNREKLNKLMTPVVFCVDKGRLALYTKEYKVLSINGVLSQRLIGYEIGERNLFVADEFNKIIENSTQPIMITDFEMLFNPEYQLDVLKLFIIASRKQKIAILWCGRFEDGILRFAEPGYVDYKSYNINDYDISCII